MAEWDRFEITFDKWVENTVKTTDDPAFTYVYYLINKELQQNLVSTGVNYHRGNVATYEDYNNTFIDGIYNQAFVLTATGQDLDKLGEELGVSRGTKTDEEYRQAIIIDQNVRLNGSTRKTVIDYLELNGYTVDLVFIGYRHLWGTELGGDSDGTIDNGFFLVPSYYCNFVTYFYVSPTPSDSQRLILEGNIYEIAKVTNFIYVR